tara:strand:- start:27 stop:530 length:504 start_codon:yes stop_codon:yes gene_type:complete
MQVTKNSANNSGKYKIEYYNGSSWVEVSNVDWDLRSALTGICYSPNFTGYPQSDGTGTTGKYTGELWRIVLTVASGGGSGWITGFKGINHFASGGAGGTGGGIQLGGQGTGYVIGSFSTRGSSVNEGHNAEHGIIANGSGYGSGGGGARDGNGGHGAQGICVIRYAV